MKFVVKRSSGFNPPCEEAKRESIVRIETYRYTSPEEYDKAYRWLNKQWFSEGTNHRINKHGLIARDNGMVEVWTVEINTLEDLMEFYDKYGSIIIDTYFWSDDTHMLEIYDDYRE